KGDKILQVNEVSVENIQPEVLANLLCQTAFLTIHRPAKNPIVYTHHHKLMYQPYDKEHGLLEFSFTMVRKDNDSETWEMPGSSKSGNLVPLVPDTKMKDGLKECEEESMLVVKLTQPSFSIVKGRGAQRSPGTTCMTCQKKDCDLHNVAVMSSTSLQTLTTKSGGNNFDNTVNYVPNSFIHHYYVLTLYLLMLTGRPLRSLPYSSLGATSSYMTIYHYKSCPVENTFSGMPVVLNFTNTNCYLACVEENGNVILKIEDCSAESLRNISESSPFWHFVFYMKTSKDRNCRFESAKFKQWYIDSKYKPEVEMTRNSDDGSFYFLVSP
uniref:Interleukin-1 n=1 Tax=Latimeria chalumnae TaxID=7897 RepID=H3B449_LATCH